MKSYSFTDYLDGFGAANPPELAYREDNDLDAWREALRAKLDELRGPVPPRVDLEYITVETVREDDHTRHLLDVKVNAFATLPAYLMIPNDLEEGERRPGMLITHGHAPRGIEDMSGESVDRGDDPARAYALCAVRSGYVVIAPAWWGWPGRDGHVERVRARDKCNAIQMAASMYGVNVIDLHIQDAQAALDVLVSCPEVDSARIGCAGNSYGGRTAMWCAIFDERIRACVSSGAMNTFRERSLKLSSCGIQYPFGLLRWADVPELYGLIAPRALQLQAGEGDRLITPADRDAIRDTVRSVYRRLAAEDRFDYVLHDRGHMLMWERAARFFAREL